MKLALSSRELRTVLIGGALGLVVLYVYVAMILTPLWRTTGSLGERVRSAKAELAALQQAVANEPALRQQHHRLQEAVVALNRTLPSETELPAVIEFLSGLASQTQVKIQTIFPQRSLDPLGKTGPAGQAAAEATVYEEIPIQIDAQASYHQLGTFLALVESSDKPMQVSSLRISSNPKEPRWHNVSLSILAYFAVRDGGTVAQRSAGP
jgi:Tfp pilus assembly protein PilO